jgi:hypothetical protein
MNTPWGPSQHTATIADGITEVSTAGHGGIFLSPERNDKVPIEWRRASFNGQGLRGWYEEDCDVVLVILTFPEVFEKYAGTKEIAENSFRQYFPQLKTA